MIRNANYVWSKLINTSRSLRQQVGVDLTVQNIYEIRAGAAVLNDSDRPTLEFMSVAAYSPPFWLNEEHTGAIMLIPGVYAVNFNEGLKELSSNETAFIIQRSSLNRSGAQLHGSVFDPGFYTPQLGATLYVHVPILIFRHARLAQLIIMDSEEATVLYSGQYQGKAN